MALASAVPRDTVLSRECAEQETACEDNGFSLDTCTAQYQDCISPIDNNDNPSSAAAVSLLGKIDTADPSLEDAVNTVTGSEPVSSKRSVRPRGHAPHVKPAVGKGSKQPGHGGAKAPPHFTPPAPFHFNDVDRGVDQQRAANNPGQQSQSQSQSQGQGQGQPQPQPQPQFQPGS
ncbi:hypothetical protein SISNIDRAFT_486248 [Sistotremastrum niveocremeum HHB9708]|uniref:Uncharacterized protein n=1 Tax=Sistotremastrum niveocremeum HHB9708 TaxID=1314777 RepID=A0A164TY53_9AGAM|nr:hypothetical protein SISNIDRAFT_486248 [Sistotremastrum niveocremeum HHB9708]